MKQIWKGYNKKKPVYCVWELEDDVIESLY